MHHVSISPWPTVKSNFFDINWFFMNHVKMLWALNTTIYLLSSLMKMCFNEIIFKHLIVKNKPIMMIHDDVWCCCSCSYNVHHNDDCMNINEDQYAGSDVKYFKGCPVLVNVFTNSFLLCELAEHVDIIYNP